MERKLLLTTERFAIEEVTRVYADGRAKTKAIMRHPGAVAILPLLDDEHVVLLDNYRVSVDRRLIEIPAGTLERGEQPLLAARRELREETGYEAYDWKELATLFLAPGVTDERMHVFVARELETHAPLREAGEEMENRIVRWRDAVAMVHDGAVQDAKTIAALLLWDSRRRSRDS